MEDKDSNNTNASLKMTNPKTNPLTDTTGKNGMSTPTPACDPP